MGEASNSTEYWAAVFREQHVANVEGVFELGRRFEECEDMAGGRTLAAASNEAGYKKSSVSKIRAVYLRADSRFNTVKRRLPSGWGTLYQLTTLTDEEWQAALDGGAIHPNMTRAEAIKLRRPEFSAPENETPEGFYDVIYCDPPWRYEHVKTESRAIENQYPTMSLEEIKALPVPAAEDCTLFMWATSPKLAEALEVISAWGFTYRTNATWVKDKIGMGYYFRQRHELLLVATKGTPGTPDTGARPDSVIEAPRLAHSAKPGEVYALIETMYPQHKRIELFARATRDGWDAWGNQADGA